MTVACSQTDLGFGSTMDAALKMDLMPCRNLQGNFLRRPILDLKIPLMNRRFGHNKAVLEERKISETIDLENDNRMQSNWLWIWINNGYGPQNGSHTM